MPPDGSWVPDAHSLPQHSLAIRSVEICIRIAFCRSLEDISTAEKGLAAAKEKLYALSAEVAAHKANQPEQQPI